MHAYLLRFWIRHCELGSSHAEWVHRHAKPIALKRGQRLFEPEYDHRHRHLYFVCQGLLATAWWDKDGRRSINRLLLPNDSALTTHNLYTHRHVHYSVVALRPSTVLSIPADVFKAYKESCWEADVLADVLEHKKLKQHRTKDRLMLAPDHLKRYIMFYDTMQDIRNITSQREQAEYLGISKMSITRALTIIRSR